MSSYKKPVSIIDALDILIKLTAMNFASINSAGLTERIRMLAMAGLNEGQIAEAVNLDVKSVKKLLPK